jgi:N-acetylglucosaminyl-diphospho-decaprenol L-rhamnosyltransferase
VSISAIVVNYRTAQLLPPLLAYLKACREVSEILVIDNSGELAGAGPSGPGVRVLVNEVNRGFGVAVNQAAGIATGEWLLVVNPDVRLEGRCVETLMEAAIRHGAPIVGPRFYWDDAHQFRIPPATGSSLWLEFARNAAGRHRLDAELFLFYWILRHDRFWDAREPFFEPFLSGACLLINREWAFQSEGKPFDERFFVYFEDADLCARALQGDRRPLCVPGATAVHYYDQSPSPERGKLDLMGESSRAFLGKYYGSVSFPALEGGGYVPNVTDMGPLTEPFGFTRETASEDEKVTFEVGISALMVPFVQTEIRAERFQFPAPIWDRIAPGRYFGRLRGSLSGVRKVWTWTKP